MTINDQLVRAYFDSEGMENTGTNGSSVRWKRGRMSLNVRRGVHRWRRTLKRFGE